MRAVLERNPEGAASRGNWADPEFSANVSELNPKLKDTQFADYHGHGWNFRAIFKRDRKGNLLDDDNNIISADDPEKFKKAVHLGLDPRRFRHAVRRLPLLAGQLTATATSTARSQAAIEITCTDCHGTATRYPEPATRSGPPRRRGGTDLSLLRTPDGRAPLRMARRQAVSALGALSQASNGK